MEAPIIHTHFGREPLELAVLEPPEDVLGAVSADAEVEAVHLAEGARPDRRVDEVLHEAVPHPQHVRLAHLGLGREPRVLQCGLGWDRIIAIQCLPDIRSTDLRSSPKSV